VSQHLQICQLSICSSVDFLVSWTADLPFADFPFFFFFSVSALHICLLFCRLLFRLFFWQDLDEAQYPTTPTSTIRYSPDSHRSFLSALEEEECRLLEQHDEATNGDVAAAANRKRHSPRLTQAANTTLIKEDAAAAREFEETAQPNKKAVRPLLQTSDLKGAGGLLFVRRLFPSERE
jgi:hypothetical protein